jgi:hypothetical protein
MLFFDLHLHQDLTGYQFEQKTTPLQDVDISFLNVYSLFHIAHSFAVALHCLFLTCSFQIVRTLHHNLYHVIYSLIERDREQLWLQEKEKLETEISKLQQICKAKEAKVNKITQESEDILMSKDSVIFLF